MFDAAFQAQLTRLLAWRRDVRRFQRTTLPDGALERLIAIACLAPSVGLSQPWRFVIVEDAARRAAVRDDYRRCNAEALAAQDAARAGLYARLKLAGLDEAPAHLAIFCDRGTPVGHGLGRRTMPEMADYSVVTAAHTLWLAARAQGIGMGWVSILDPVAIARVLDAPTDWRFIGYFCLGYPLEETDQPALATAGWEARRPRDDVVLRR